MSKFEQLTKYIDALDGDGFVGVGGVQQHGVDGVDDGVLLHVHMEQHVHAELEELPQHADGHGKAEGGEGKEKG